MWSIYCNKNIIALLLTALAITKWQFERTPNDCCFQWYASGQLPIGTKGCVGRPLVSAGGSGDGNCHGAGKRAEDNISS
jgi:hypothetical protein